MSRRLNRFQFSITQLLVATIVVAILTMTALRYIDREKVIKSRYSSLQTAAYGIARERLAKLLTKGKWAATKQEIVVLGGSGEWQLHVKAVLVATGKSQCNVDMTVEGSVGHSESGLPEWRVINPIIIRDVSNEAESFIAGGLVDAFLEAGCEVQVKIVTNRDGG